MNMNEPLYIQSVMEKKPSCNQLLRMLPSASKPNRISFKPYPPPSLVRL
jgi:hypothetical protein